MARSRDNHEANLRDAGASEPLLVFVHIRKTAGKTLRQVLYRQYRRNDTKLVKNYFTQPERSFDEVRELASAPPPGLRVAHGHMLFWPDLPWPAEARFFTMLRDPIERAISHYYWLRARSSRFRRTLDEAISDGSIHDNLQTRVLSATMSPFGELPRSALETAIERLDRFAVVGITERFDESLALMTDAFGWQWRLYRRENVTPGREPRDSIAPETLALIEQHNALDLELYRVACQRFQDALTRQGDNFHLEAEALERAVARAREIPDGAPLDVQAAPVAGDLRARLVETRADVLLRDAEIEHLRAQAREHPLRTTEPKEPRVSPEDRAANLERAATAARRRLGPLREELHSVEAEGGPADPERLEMLRSAVATAERRLAGFERRRAKLRRRAEQTEDAGDAQFDSLPG